MTISTELLRSIEPRQVAAWLRANGWELLSTLPDHTATYRKAAGETEEFLVELPLDAAFRDYPRRIAEVLETLAVSSQRPLSWLLVEVRASTFDIIRLRATGPSVGPGRVSMDLGARLIFQAREMILAAACAAHDPRPVFRTRKPVEALAFLHRVKLAAPEEGSFIVTMHAPIPPGLQVAFVGGMEEVPFERRSTLMLATASAAARLAAVQAGLGGGAQPFVDGTAQGISANLCEALAGFVDGEETTALEMNFSWASSRMVPSGTPTTVHLGADLSPVLREGARWLQATSPTPDFELEGAVVRLESVDPDAGGVAFIAGQVDGRPRKVRVGMVAQDYAQAIRAHEQGLLLRCEGELSRQGNRFQLERVRHVALVADDE